MDTMVPITIKQADTEGRIRDLELMVVPKRNKPSTFSFFPFGKKHRAAVAATETKASIKAQALQLIDAVYAKKKREAEAALSDVTAGEKELVLQGVDKEHQDHRNRTSNRGQRTHEVIVQCFNAEDENSLDRLGIVLEHTRFVSNETSTRERMIFDDCVGDSYWGSIEPCINNLRTCHPALAREDLSDLEGEELALAKRLAVMAINRYEAESDKISQKINYTESHWKKELRSAQQEICRYTPHMTETLVNVILNHPDRLEQVLTELAKRDMPLNQADDFINATISSSSAISEGAL